MDSGSKLFECVELFRVNEGLSDEEHPNEGAHAQNSVTIELSCWREVDSHSTLVVVCSNDYIVIKATPASGAAVMRQLKWFESRQQHILDIAMDRYGQWLACACLDGALYLLPVVSLVLGQVPIFSFGELDDLTVILPSKKRAPPTCLAWWETMDNRHMCITGSEAGELTFFDLNRHCDLLTMQFSSCIDSMQLAHKANWYTYLLINIRGGQWQHVMLEERLHEASKISFTEASSIGFEVLPDEVVVKSLVGTKGEQNTAFKAQPVMSFNELTKLSSHDWKESHFLGALNLKSHKFEVYHYEFDMSPNLINVCQLVKGATNVIMADRLMFVISHNDDVNEFTFNLNIMSWQRAVESSVQLSMSQAQTAVVQLFTIPSHGALVGFYPLHSCRKFDNEDIGTLPPTHLGGCIVVTTMGVYQCRQMRSPESVFLELCLGATTPEKAESCAITYKLDICALYQLAGQKKLEDKKFSQALLLFDMAKCSTLEILEKFSKLGRMQELVQYLHRIVYQSEIHGLKSGPRELQDLLIKCFVHQCLEIQDQYEAVSMSDKFVQFVRDQFLYNQTVAMELLISCGLKEQLLELAKTHQKLSEALSLLMCHGSLRLESSAQSSLSSRQYVESLSSVSEGLLLYLINSSTFINFLVAVPSLIPHHLHYLRSLLPGLNIRTLVKLAHLLDPYNPSICPLLKRAHSKRRNSTGSTVSSAASDGEGEPGDSPHPSASPSLETYIELFLTVLIILNHKRRAQSPDSSLSISSPMSGQTYTKHLVALSEGSQVVQSNPLAAGLHHAAIVLDGSLYTWGSNKNGKLGHGDIEEEGQSLPTRVETLHMLSRQVLAVCCGAEHTVAVCQDGLFSWGASSHGQLGHGDRLKKTRPVQIAALADKNVTSVVCGQYHCLALDGDQRVWSWGWGVHGQLGLQSTDDRLFPVHVSVLDPREVSFIAAGYGHSAVLSSKGEVLVFGNGMHGQLGLGNSEKQSCPVVVSGLQKRNVYLIGCGNFHTVAVCTDQSVYYWGKNLQRLNPPPSQQGGRKNVKGRPNHSFHNTLVNSFTPQLMSGTEFDDTVTQISCGGFHTMFLTAAGSVYACGKNQSGQLGLGQATELLCPKRLPHFDKHKIVSITAGDEFCLALDDTGTPWVWGKGEHGQLGIEDQGQSLGTPLPNETLRLKHESSRQSGVESPGMTEPSLFALDMGWELCNFSAFGSDHVPYGREALGAALQHLHGFYRPTPIIQQLYLSQDWSSLTTIYHSARQWSQALECALLECFSDKVATSASAAGEVVKTYLDLFISGNKNQHSYSFVTCGLQMVTCVFNHWQMRGLSFAFLEGLLSEHLSTLAYTLSLFLSRNHALAAGVSLEFHMKVVSAVQLQIGSGLPKPEDIILSHSKDSKKVVMETSDRDERLWSEIRRNLFKDLHKGTSIYIAEQALASLETQEKKEGPVLTTELRPETIVAFTCGHSFLESHFQSKIVPEFVERAHNSFPVPIRQTLKHLQSHYKQSQFYSCACPYCVFQYLRKEQLDAGTPPSNPIYPWNP